MTATDLKTQLTNKINQLPPSLLKIVNDFISTLPTELEAAPESPESSENSSDIDDSIVGMIDGSPDTASNAENILYEEIKSESGWSWRQ